MFVAFFMRMITNDIRWDCSFTSTRRLLVGLGSSLVGPGYEFKGGKKFCCLSMNFLFIFLTFERKYYFIYKFKRFLLFGWWNLALASRILELFFADAPECGGKFVFPAINFRRSTNGIIHNN